MSTDDKGGISRREMMTGLGAGAGLVLAAGLPLTAAAGPVANHVPAWAPWMPKDLAVPTPNLSYVNIDGAAFHAQNEADYLDSLSGRGVGDGDGQLIAPLMLEVGSVIRQFNVSYLCPSPADISLQIFARDFLSAGNVAWAPIATGVAPGGNGALTATINFASPVVIEHGKSYTIQFRAAVPGTSIRGLTVGYLPPTAGFVPFDGATPRVLDTRTTGNRLTFQEEITLNLGNPGVRGALFNLTVTETENGGFVAAFAADVAYPGNSSVNYTATGQTVANGVVSGVAPDGTILLRGGGPLGSCHVIVDRLGWFV